VKRTRHQYQAALLALTTSFLVVLTGCSTSGRSFTPEEVDLDACAVLGEVAAADISEGERAPCDLAGASFVYPDGMVTPVPGILVSGSQESSDHDGYTYFIENLGIYGVVASRAEQGTPKGPREFWGRPDAIEILKEADGLR
jgi:hypothetical protein